MVKYKNDRTSAEVEMAMIQMEMQRSHVRSKGIGNCRASDGLTRFVIRRWAALKSSRRSSTNIIIDEMRRAIQSALEKIYNNVPVRAAQDSRHSVFAIELLRRQEKV